MVVCAMEECLDCRLRVGGGDFVMYQLIFVGYGGG